MHARNQKHVRMLGLHMLLKLSSTQADMVLHSESQSGCHHALKQGFNNPRKEALDSPCAK